MSHTHAWRPEEGAGSPRTRVTDGYEQTWGAGVKRRSSQEQPVLFMMSLLDGPAIVQVPPIWKHPFFREAS